jgi:hypothetical protein
MSKKESELKIDIDEDTARGLYTNLALISHSETEFVIDFTFLQPNQPKTKVLQRIITSPLHAKRFVAALSDNIRKFEEQFGEVEDAARENVKPADTYQ